MKQILIPVQSFLATSSGWAIVCCVVGIASTFVRWVHVSVQGWNPGWLSAIQQEHWYGKGIAVGLLCLALIELSDGRDLTSGYAYIALLIDANDRIENVRIIDKEIPWSRHDNSSER